MKQKHREALKLAIVEAARLAGLFIGVFVFLGRLAPLLPWWALVAIWLTGAVVIHVWIYRGMLPRPFGYLDFSVYSDSGIPLTVALWPAFFLTLLIPEIAQRFAEKIVGIYWEAGERKFR